MSFQEFPEREIYRKLAGDCLARAETCSEDAVAGLIRLAQHWLEKAGDYDRRTAAMERAISEPDFVGQLAAALHSVPELGPRT